MSLYTDWRAEIDALEDQSEAQYEFWQKYCSEEAEIYKSILANKTEVVEGVISELADQYKVGLNWFTGFLDGISESLKTPLENLETLEATDSIRLDIDFEKLYWNMLAVPAEWL
ncbi:MAG: SEC-C domain-containing protein, partial [Eubacterium sp.]|nr:SEC-C domain-containing protein [Eubacterium sp.]